MFWFNLIYVYICFGMALQVCSRFCGFFYVELSTFGSPQKLSISITFHQFTGVVSSEQFVSAWCVHTVCSQPQCVRKDLFGSERVPWLLQHTKSQSLLVFNDIYFRMYSTRVLDIFLFDFLKNLFGTDLECCSKNWVYTLILLKLNDCLNLTFFKCASYFKM